MSTLDLTMKQTRAYLEEVQLKFGKAGPAGEALNNYDCPLVRAYKHSHPDAESQLVNIGVTMAVIGTKSYELWPWHRQFTLSVDTAFYSPRLVPVDFCLSILADIEKEYMDE